MESTDNYSQKLVRAQKRVKDIKKFYRHLRIFTVVNIIILFFKFRALNYFEDKGIQDEGFIDWFEWNIIGTPVIWGIGLGLHAIYVFVLQSKPLKEFKPRFYKEWEERQIKKYMKEES